MKLFKSIYKLIKSLFTIAAGKTEELNESVKTPSWGISKKRLIIIISV